MSVFTPVQGKKKQLMSRYKRELQVLRTMIEREMESLEEDAADFSVGSAMKSVTLEIAQIAIALKTLEDIDKF